jgi:FkbM family methyltransferase
VNYSERLKNAVDYAIETNFEIYERAINIRKDLYSHKNLCIFGTGTMFKNTSKYFAHYKCFNYVADNDPLKWGKFFDGKKCLSPQEIKAIDNIAVLIMVGEWQPIYNQLTQSGITCYPLEWYVLCVYDTRYPKTWFEERCSKIIETVDWFEDDKSKEIYVEAICNRIAPSFAKKSFKEIETPGEYFNTDVFTLGDDECFIDAGACDGDSMVEFIDAVQGKFRKIYSFEPDLTNFEELRKIKEKYDTNKIEIFNLGVSDKADGIEYQYTVENAKIAEKLVALDDVLSEQPVTFIKMDVETFEIRALDGAANIIKKQKPKLAISAYHYLSDLWEVPRKIKELVPEYKLYLRHHTAMVWDTDCYAFVK